MMHVFKRCSLVGSVLSAVLGASSLPLSLNSAASVEFGQKEVDQSKFIAIAKPVGQDSHQLLVLEQITDKKQCWSENGSNPTLIDPLLLKFDFTGICGRSTDANGYSIRMDGQDFGGKYTLRIRYRDNDMVLVGSPDNKPDPEIVVGRTNGIVRDLAKIQLDPGWYFAKRTFGPKTLGHVYLVKDSGQVPAPSNLAFTDVAGNVYVKEIQEAVALKFVAGFQGNTFKPQTALTREQLVSMILDALKTVPGVTLSVPGTIPAKPYSDVDATRWSAAKITFARDKKIVSGYQDGTFQPQKPVTRAELLAVLSSAAQYTKTLKKQPTELTPTQAVFNFSDTEKHWAAKLAAQMSGYCGVASPVNEKGTAFAPNDSALRDYAAAATLRTLKCLQKP
jgi:N-acetylmuramoyl-L-alanine amidase